MKNERKQYLRFDDADAFGRPPTGRLRVRRRRVDGDVHVARTNDPLLRERSKATMLGRIVRRRRSGADGSHEVTRRETRRRCKALGRCGPSILSRPPSPVEHSARREPRIGARRQGRRPDALRVGRWDRRLRRESTR